MFSNSSKNYFPLLITVHLLLLLVLLSTFACKSRSDKPVEAAAVNDLPQVTLIDEDGKQFSAKTLSGNTILIFFGATCDHCQREAQALQKNLQSFTKYKIYFIAMDPFPVIHAFAKDYKIDNQSNIFFLRADGNTVNATLGYLETPTIFAYNKDGKLLKRFDGETPIEDVIKALPDAGH